MIKRVHRTPPRPLIAKILSIQDKVTILRVVSLKGNLNLMGIEWPLIWISPQRSRNKGCLSVRSNKRLRDKEVSYAMIFLVQLRVITEGKPSFFKTPHETLAALDVTIDNPDIYCFDIHSCSYISFKRWSFYDVPRGSPSGLLELLPYHFQVSSSLVEHISSSSRVSDIYQSLPKKKVTRL